MQLAKPDPVRRLFSAGDGQDTIDERGMVAANLEDAAGIDVIQFSNEINPLGVSFQRYGNGDLTIRYGEGDAVTIKGQYSTVGNSIERIEFGNGTPGAGTDVISPCKVFPDLQADVMGIRLQLLPHRTEARSLCN